MINDDNLKYHKLSRHEIKSKHDNRLSSNFLLMLFYI